MRNKVAGVDAGRVGDDLVWVMGRTDSVGGSGVDFEVYRSFRELWQHAIDAQLRVVAIDMPLGVPSTEMAWRQCESEARDRLGPDRRDTVFMSPPLWLMDNRDPEQEKNWERRARRGQARENPRRLLDRCREVREVLERDAFAVSAHPRAAEVHAEVCFWKLNGERPTRFQKRKTSGQDERLELLRPEFPGLDEAIQSARRPYGAKSHHYDFLDAAAAAWSARRIESGTAKPLGSDAPDEAGYPMLIWV